MWFLKDCKAEIIRLSKSRCLPNEGIYHENSKLPKYISADILINVEGPRLSKLALLLGMYNQVSECMDASPKKDIDLRAIYAESVEKLNAVNDESGKIDFQKQVRAHRSSGMFKSMGLTKTAAFLDKYHLLDEAPQTAKDSRANQGPTM